MKKVQFLFICISVDFIMMTSHQPFTATLQNFIWEIGDSDGQRNCKIVIIQILKAILIQCTAIVYAVYGWKFPWKQFEGLRVTQLFENLQISFLDALSDGGVAIFTQKFKIQHEVSKENPKFKLLRGDSGTPVTNTFLTKIKKTSNG